MSHPHDHAHHDHSGHQHPAHSHASHGGAHHHHANPANFGRAFVIAIALNTIFVVVEFSYGFIANSTALMADAGHNLSDVLGLLLAWTAVILARQAPSPRYTYGLRSTSILAALANAMLLLVACGGIAWAALQRVYMPPEVAGLTVTLVAGAGILVNGLSAWLFMAGSKGDLNIRGAYLHMMADAVVSLGVVLGGIAMIYTGWYWLDPVISLVILAVIFISTWHLLKESMQLALNAVPQHIDVAAVESFLRQCEGVESIHDLHIWGMSTTECALTVHLVMPLGYPGDQVIDSITKALKDRFSIQHSTLQTEQGTTQHGCSLHADLLPTH
jgi:cobalt-zinc-cadmium efflux system protein